MFTQGNTKLGPLIWNWSVPAGKTCPGASPICRQLCYATRNRFKLPSVQQAHARNWETARSDEFVSAAIHEIRRRCIQVLRIHVAGDFEDLDYIRKWQEIVRRSRQTRFFGYTRSWTDAEMKPLLVELARERNVCLYFSSDKDMPHPGRIRGVRTCYLSADDSDWPKRKYDLVFRDQPKSVRKKDPKRNQVCPYDNGVTTTNCSLCKLCWTARPSKVGKSRKSTR